MLEFERTFSLELVTKKKSTNWGDTKIRVLSNLLLLNMSDTCDYFERKKG